MLSIARRTAAGAALLLIMPLAVWVSGWQWQPGHQVWWLKTLFWITETVTKPWGVITHVILCGWFLWCLRFRLRAAIMLFAILGGAIIVGQGVKSWVKERVQEPRPFVVWLEKTHHIPVDEFYTLKRTERGHLVKEQLAGQQNIPVFLRQHWQKETGFAFPSGHTMFAASWALLAVGLLWPRRRTFTIAFFVSLGDRRNGQPFASGNALAARFSGRHAHLLAISYPGDLAGAANLRAAYAASRRSARNC